jgi:hypothetical protein
MGKEGNTGEFIRASNAVAYLSRVIGDDEKVMEPERMLLGNKGTPALLVAGLQRHKGNETATLVGLAAIEALAWNDNCKQ